MEALELAQEQGITELVLTSHYLKGSYDNDRETISDTFETLKQDAAESGIEIKLHLGAEVFITQDALIDIVKYQLQINETQYVLVETDLNNFPINFNEILYNLVRSGYRPILAHPERYGNIQRDWTLAEGLLYRNVYLQINAGSLLGQYGSIIKETAWKLVENGLVHFIGSDFHCHSTDYNYREAVDAIAEQIDSHMAKLLSETNPRKLLDNKPVEYIYMNFIEQQSETKSLMDKIKDFLWNR
ncbi:MAG: capsular biosynthesis protein [Candidatus Cloacimonetes bacterium]|nr:capsular biosynthesis protein [Candidatus Cloacimonadota bacterium]